MRQVQAAARTEICVGPRLLRDNSSSSRGALSSLLGALASRYVGALARRVSKSSDDGNTVVCSTIQILSKAAYSSKITCLFDTPILHRKYFVLTWIPVDWHQPFRQSQEALRQITYRLKDALPFDISRTLRFVRVRLAKAQEYTNRLIFPVRGDALILSEACSLLFAPVLCHHRCSSKFFFRKAERLQKRPTRLYLPLVEFPFTQHSLTSLSLCSIHLTSQ